MKRITTGIEAVDRILGGGFPANSINIIMGSPGSGKTILAEQIVFRGQAGDEAGEHGGGFLAHQFGIVVLVEFVKFDQGTR